MTKKSAMLMAAGLVAALLGGAVALSFGLSGNGTAQAETKAPDPIVRTIHRTVTVEKDPKPAEQPVQVVQVASAPAMANVTGSDDAYEGESDDAYEHEGDDEGEHGSEGSDDSGSDHSSEDSGGEHEDD